MRRDHYPLLMGLLVAAAVLGLAVKYEHVYLFHVVAGLVVLRSLAVRTPGSLLCRFRPPSSYHQFFGFMGAWFALGLIWSWERRYTLEYLCYVGCGGMLAVSLIKFIGGSVRRFEDMFTIAKWMFLADIAVGLLESFRLLRLPVSPLAEGGKVRLNHEHSTEALSHVLTMPTGFHWNPNNYAVVMLMLLPFFLFHRRVAVRLGGLAAVTLLIFYAGSRGCLAAMACMLLAATLYSKQRIWMFAGVAGAAAAGCFLLSGLFTDYEHVQNPKLREALSTVNALTRYLSPDESSDTNSLGVRRQLIKNGLDALHDTYGLGVGGGADRYVQERFRWTVADFTAMHNFWVELLVGGGCLFFIVLAVWYGRLTYELFLWSRRLGLADRRGYFCGSLSLGLIGFLPGAISASTAIYILPMYMLFGLSVAMVNVCRANTDSENSPPGKAVARPHFLDRRRSRTHEKQGRQAPGRWASQNQTQRGR